MAEYFLNPQGLDDDDDNGELWKFLPSDIFPVDQQITSSSSYLNLPNNSYRNYNNNLVNYQQQQHLSCMGIDDDRLCQSFAAFYFSERSPPPPHTFLIMPPPNSGRIRPAVQCVSCSGSLPVRCCVRNGCLCGTTNHVLGYGNEAVWTSDVPLYPYHFMNQNPVLSQAECFIEERVRALLDRQRRTMANRVVENPVFPFSGGSGGGGGNGVGYLRDYGGTGVFLPRLPANISSASSADPIHHPRRRQGARNRHDEEAHEFLYPRNSFMNMVHMKKQEDYRSQVSPEMGLPEDWTY